MAARKLTAYKEAEAALVEFEDKYSTIIVNCTTTEGMRSAKDCRKEIRDARSNLEDLRKETKAPVLAKGKQIDAEAKAITVRLDTLFTKFDTAIKAMENKAAIAKQQELDDALQKVQELEEREAAIVAKEIELGIREPEVADSSSNTDDSAIRGSGDNSSTPADVKSTPIQHTGGSTICEPHIKAAAERLAALKAIRKLVEATDEQPGHGDIDNSIAVAHDGALADIWSVVDVYK